MLNIEEIKAILPQRHPFLMVDRILELEPGKRALGLKHVTINEYYFPGHFPNYHVVPGVLIVESLAQVGAVAILTIPKNRGKNAVFVAIDDFRFRKFVRPGDTMTLEVVLKRTIGNIGKGAGRATVDGDLVAEGDLSFLITSLGAS